MKLRYLPILLRQFRYRFQSILCPFLNLFRKHKHLPHVFFHFEGWFDFDDIYLEQAKRAKGGSVFVEVGTYLGKSLSFLVVECYNRKKQVTIYAVDTWEGSPEHGEFVQQVGGSIYPIFQKNMERFHLQNLFQPLQMTSEAASKCFQDQSIDFIFIDAAHDYDNVSADLRNWYPKLKVGGIIAGHDFTAVWDGVIRAVKEFFQNDFTVRGVSWYHKKKTTHPTSSK